MQCGNFWSKQEFKEEQVHVYSCYVNPYELYSFREPFLESFFFGILLLLIYLQLKDLLCFLQRTHRTKDSSFDGRILRRAHPLKDASHVEHGLPASPHLTSAGRPIAKCICVPVLVNAAVLVSLKLPLQVVCVPGSILSTLLDGILHKHLLVKTNHLQQPFHLVLVMLVLFCHARFFF